MICSLKRITSLFLPLSLFIHFDMALSCNSYSFCIIIPQFCKCVSQAFSIAHSRIRTTNVLIQIFRYKTSTQKRTNDEAKKIMRTKTKYTKNPNVSTLFNLMHIIFIECILTIKKFFSIFAILFALLFPHSSYHFPTYFGSFIQTSLILYFSAIFHLSFE